MCGKISSRWRFAFTIEMRELKTIANFCFIVYVRVKISVIPKRSKLWLHFIKVDQLKLNATFVPMMKGREYNKINVALHLKRTVAPKNNCQDSVCTKKSLP